MTTRAIPAIDVNYVSFGEAKPKKVDEQYRINAIHAAKDFRYTEIIPDIIAQIKACKTNDQISIIMRRARDKKWNAM